MEPAFATNAAEDLVVEITNLVNANPPFDWVLIESTGISEPMQVCKLLQSHPGTRHLFFASRLPC